MCLFVLLKRRAPKLMTATTEMELEIEAPDHSKILVLNSDCSTEIGRASSAGDRTISRRHVLLKPSLSAAAENETPEPRACFEVAGKNPVFVRRGTQGGNKIEIFRSSERGELGCGDAICLSGRSPAWFLVKKRSGGDDRENQSEIDLESIDPVKEFGFLVAGREFDQYPKHRIRDVKNWNWFLEESGEESSDDGGRSRKKRRKSAEKDGSDDEDWTGESEEDREVMKRGKKTGGKPAYTTRSRDNKRSGSSKSKGGSSVGKMSGEDEDDETLGGFIVEDEDDDNVAELEEEEDDEDEDEEEEFDDDDDDDEEEDE